MYYTTVQDFVAYEVLRRGCKIHNILKYLDVFLVKFGRPDYMKQYEYIKNHTFVHYLGDVKPWEKNLAAKLKVRRYISDEIYEI